MKEPRDPRRTSSQYSCTSTFVSSEPRSFTHRRRRRRRRGRERNCATTTTTTDNNNNNNNTARSTSTQAPRITRGINSFFSRILWTHARVRSSRMYEGEDDSSVGVVWRECRDRPFVRSPRNHLNSIDSRTTRSREIYARRANLLSSTIRWSNAIARKLCSSYYVFLILKKKSHSRAKSETHPGAFASAASTHCVGLASGSCF